MPTVEDLGQLIKTKYPGSYDDISDNELGQKIQAKYPGSYDDFTPAENRQQSTLAKIGGFLKDRVGQFNEQTSFANPKSPTLQEIQNVAGVALGAINPESGVAGGIKNATYKFLGKEAPQAGRTLAQRLMDKALGTSSKTIEAGRSPAAQLLKEGLVGTSQGLRRKAQTIIDEVDPKISSLVEASKASHPVNQLFQNIADKLKTGGGTFSLDELKQIVKTAAPKVRDFVDKNVLTTKELNKFRSGLDKVLSDRFFLQTVHPFNKEVVGELANNARGIVQKTVPETKPLFQRYTAAIRAVQSTGKQLARNSAIPFATVGGPTAIGYLTGDTKRGAAAGLALEAVRQGRKNPLFLSTAANLLDKLGPNVETKTATAVRTLFKKGLITAGPRLLGREQKREGQ